MLLNAINALRIDYYIHACYDSLILCTNYAVRFANPIYFDLIHAFVQCYVPLCLTACIYNYIHACYDSLILCTDYICCEN